MELMKQLLQQASAAIVLNGQPKEPLIPGAVKDRFHASDLHDLAPQPDKDGSQGDDEGAPCDFGR